MTETTTRGTLICLRPENTLEGGALHEEELPFGTLGELLELCATKAADRAFVRVQIVSSGPTIVRRLVLDFGHFESGAEGEGP